MTSEAVHELLLRSYEQFKFFRSFGTKKQSSGVIILFSFQSLGNAVSIKAFNEEF